MYKAYPLQWPLGYAKTKKRESSQFKMSADKARKELQKQIVALSGDDKPVISSNVPIRQDGNMYADMANDKIDNPGVAVYFQYNDHQVTLACDAWLTPAENIRAIGLTVEAMRGMDRWKFSEILKRSFRGFGELPPAGAPTDKKIEEQTIWKTLGLKEKPDTVEEVHRAYKLQTKKVHPDAGGTTEAFQQLQDAYKLALGFFNVSI